MAHYAFLKNNIVTEIIVGIDETELIEGLSPEDWYGNFRGQRCIRTSYNGKIRGKYAAVGDFYDEETDTFISPIYPTGLTDTNFDVTGATGNTGATGRFVAPVAVESVVTANDKLIEAGLSQDEIAALIQEATQ